MKPTAATWVTLSNQQQGFFYILHPRDRIVHTMAFMAPVLEHWLEQKNSSMGPPCGIDPTTHCTMNKHSTMELHLAPDYVSGDNK